MTIKQAMEELIDMGVSKYKIAKTMDMQSIMVDNFLKESQTTIRREAADKLKVKFKIEIDDIYINGYQKQMFVDKHNKLDYN